MRQKGMALVLVLWVLSLLTIMAGSFSLGMRRETSLIEGIKNNAQAMAVAESGIAMAEMMLLIPDQNKRWRADGSIYEINAENAKVRVRLLSEAGKIDINTADQTLLQNLISHTPLEEEQQTKLVSAILDWRDKDDLIHIEGAEKKEYKQAGLSYQPRNKPFQSLEELQLVLGMDKSVFSVIEPLITVYSRQAQVAVQLATKEVLQVIPGLDMELVESYLTNKVESARNNLPAPPFPSGSGTALNNAGGQQVLTVVSEALLDDDSNAVVSVVIKQANEIDAQNIASLLTPFQVLKWQYVTTNDSSLFSDAMSELLVKQYAEPELNN